jgi:hypothetical protein
MITDLNKPISIITNISIQINNANFESHLKNEKDCMKYGTGSGMLCCWVALNDKTKDGSCYLIPETIAIADAKKLNGIKNFTIPGMKTLILIILFLFFIY